MTIEATILDNIISATIVGDINIDVDTADLLANDVTFTGVKTFRTSIVIGGGPGDEEADFELTSRPGIGFPVPIFRPVNGPNLPLALDGTASGTSPTEISATSPFVFQIDGCNKDPELTADFSSFRLGIQAAGEVMLSNQGFGTTLSKDLVLGYGSQSAGAPKKAVRIYGADGADATRAGNLAVGVDTGGNGTRSIHVVNTNTGTVVRSEVHLHADTADILLRAFGVSNTLESNTWQGDFAILNDTGNIVASVPTGKEWQFLEGTAKTGLKARIGSAGITSTGYLKSGSFTVGTVPSAATSGAGALIYVSNETGGAVHAFSDSSNWRRVTDRTIIS